VTGGDQLRIDDSIVRKSESLNLRELDGEGVLYDASTKAMHVLNRTALLVWQLCDSKENAEAVASEIVGRYDIPPEHALRDVMECLRLFEELSLMRRETS
jgi:hypothetical protein